MTDQIETALLPPPYRPELRDRLAPQTIDTISVPGPMMRPGRDPTRPCWIDGLDSV